MGNVTLAPIGVSAAAARREYAQLVQLFSYAELQQLSTRLSKLPADAAVKNSGGHALSRAMFSRLVRDSFAKGTVPESRERGWFDDFGLRESDS